MKAAELKAGDKVMYHDVPATVVGVRSNGVIVSYWMGENNITRRVSARYLSAAGAA